MIKRIIDVPFFGKVALLKKPIVSSSVSEFRHLDVGVRFGCMIVPFIGMIVWKAKYVGNYGPSKAVCLSFSDILALEETIAGWEI